MIDTNDNYLLPKTLCKLRATKSVQRRVIPIQKGLWTELTTRLIAPYDIIDK